jgi:DNA-binding GntR family transcriptional regulator
MPPPWWPTKRQRRRAEGIAGLHAELEGAVGDRDRFFAINERFHMRLLELAGNRWRNQMVADLRKVMKLNRHNSLLKSGRIEESLARRSAGGAARAVMQALPLKARRGPFRFPAPRSAAHAGAFRERAGSGRLIRWRRSPRHPRHPA